MIKIFELNYGSEDSFGLHLQIKNPIDFMEKLVNSFLEDNNCCFCKLGIDYKREIIILDKVGNEKILLSLIGILEYK